MAGWQRIESLAGVYFSKRIIRVLLLVNAIITSHIDNIDNMRPCHAIKCVNAGELYCGYIVWSDRQLYARGELN